MQRTGNQLLAGSGLSGDQNGRICFHNTVHTLKNKIHCRRAADYITELEASLKLLAQIHIFRKKLLFFQSLDNNYFQFFKIYWFGYVIKRPVFHSPDSGLSRSVSGYNDDFSSGRSLLHVLQNIETAFARQEQIGNNDLKLFTVSQFQSLFTRCRRSNVIPD